MSRERYNIDIMCPKCGAMATARISENDYPFMSKLDREIISVSDNFKILGRSKQEDLTYLKCACGNVFEA